MSDDPADMPTHGMATLNFSDPELVKTFFSVLGQCIVEWSFVDRAIFDCFVQFLGTDEKRAAVIYYSNSRFEGRKQITEELAAIVLDESLKKVDPLLFPSWKAMMAEIQRLQPFRTILAHQPVEQTGEIIWDTWAVGGPTVIKAEVKFHVAIQEKELLRGKKKARTIVLAELQEHHKDVLRLKQSFAPFLSQLATARSIAEQSAQRDAASRQDQEAPTHPTAPESQ